MADIVYRYYDGVYLNITNQCPCNCAFCIRSKGDAVGDAKEMWFDTEPTWQEIKAAIDAYDFAHTDEAVFVATASHQCAGPPAASGGLSAHGEPKDSSAAEYQWPVGLNQRQATAELLCRHFDSISVSLNEPTAEKYDKITRNCYGGKAFDAMLQFTRECVAHCPDVRMTVVDVISPEDIEKSRQVCESTGAKFRVRSFAAGR